jgi:amidohydrolase
MLTTEIHQIAERIYTRVVAFRREMHQNPELSFQEFETQKRIQHFLTENGINNIEVSANTGLIVLIEGNNPTSATVALRADIDALPIKEANKVEYSSSNEGVMHACGHDAHTSSLLGTALILNELKNQFSGTFKLIFQPGEERIPGGASIMIKEGVLKNPTVDSMLGQHVMPLIEVGKVGYRKGLYMASADEIYITINGKGGHGAHPHLNIDPIAISAQVITGLQQLVSRMAKPAIPTVLSIGKIVGNGSTNVIPDKVEMEGTFRTFDEDWRMQAHELIKKTIHQITEALGGNADVEIRIGYPYLKNNDEVTERAKNAAIEYLGEDNVVDLEIWPAGEDFAFYSQEVPSCFYRLGTRNESRNITSMLHTPTFDIDEKALRIGCGLMAYSAISEIKFICG